MFGLSNNKIILGLCFAILCMAWQYYSKQVNADASDISGLKQGYNLQNARMTVIEERSRINNEALQVNTKAVKELLEKVWHIEGRLDD